MSSAVAKARHREYQLCVEKAAISCEIFARSAPPDYDITSFVEDMIFGMAERIGCDGITFLADVFVQTALMWEAGFFDSQEFAKILIEGQKSPEIVNTIKMITMDAPAAIN